VPSQACAGWPKSIPPLISTSKSMSGAVTETLLFAQWLRNNTAQLVVEALSRHDGHPQGEVLELPPMPFNVDGPVRANDGSLWFTVTSGPCVRNNTAGGNPAPNTCSGAVFRFDPASRTSKVMLQSPRSLLIGGAVPSPDGTRVAYQAGGCDTSYFNMHLVIRDLRTGQDSILGPNPTPCHAFWSVAWSADGSKLLIAYSPSTLEPTTSFVPHGTCEGSIRSSVPLELGVRGDVVVGDSRRPCVVGCQEGGDDVANGIWREAVAGRSEVRGR
jgi:hypothetical protein